MDSPVFAGESSTLIAIDRVGFGTVQRVAVEWEWFLLVPIRRLVGESRTI